ncbi:hypothetical protein VTN96DRAFT_423 [Rasamsonia emersonii]
MSKLITVFGATGTQGGSVIRAILADAVLSQEFKIRAITRNVSKPAAQALQKLGVEADMTSKSSLASAISGSHSVFLVTTPSWDASDPNAELVQGKNVADAAREAGHVSHFDQKAQVEQYIRATGVPCTFVLPGYYMENYIRFGMLRRDDEGVYTLVYPVGKEAKFPLLDGAEDMGKFVLAALKHPSKLLGARILAATEYYTPPWIVAEFEEATGKRARYIQVDAQTYKSFLPPAMADVVLENQLLIEDPGYYAGEGLEESLELLGDVGFEPTTWREFLERNKDVFE